MMLRRIALGIVALILLATMTFACSSQPAAVPTRAATVLTPTTAAMAEPTPLVPTATALPKPTPIPPTPTSVPKAATIAKIGERVESAGIALTVNVVNKVGSSGNQFIQPKAGNLYLVVDVTVENTSREKSPYNPFYFKVKDGDGYEYTTGFFPDDKALKSGELASGEKARGTVAFEVPKTGKGLVASYQPLVILGGYQVIRVSLE